MVAGDYDTPNRQYTTNQGRWFNPDPAGSGWNQYAYGTNPQQQTDPSGLVIINPAFGIWDSAELGDYFFGGVQVAWPTSPASGTVGADLNWGPPTAPGSATGLGSLSSGGGSDYPGTVNLQEDACIGCNESGDDGYGGKLNTRGSWLGNFFHVWLPHILALGTLRWAMGFG